MGVPGCSALGHGHCKPRPAVSLYLTVNEGLEIVGHESRLERVHVAANLRHHDIEPLFNAETVRTAVPDFPYRDQLLTLWQFACACEKRRGKPSAMQGINDYNFDIAGDLADDKFALFVAGEQIGRAHV